MKKLIALLLAAVMVLGLVACGSSNNSTATTAAAATDAAAEAPADTGKVDTSNMTPEEKAAAEAEIRYAISLLYDRNYIVEEIGQAGQVPASSFVAMGMTDADGSEFYQNAGHNDGFYGYWDVSEDAYEDNFSKGIEILSKYYDYDETTGQFTNFPTLTYLYNTSEGHKAIGEYLAATLASVGITMNLENQEWNTFLNTRKAGDYSVARNGWLADFNDPITFLDMWTTASGNNDVQFGKGENADVKAYSLDLTPYGIDVKVENGTWAETYDVLIDTILHTTDKDTRYKLMHEAEDLLMSTGCIVPLYFYTDVYMLDDTVHGFFVNPLGYKFFYGADVDGKTDSISVCLASEPDVIDPALNSALDGGTMDSHLFSGLSKWAEDENGHAIIVADSAEELVAPVENEDGSVTYTYTLRDNKWSDGQPVTAHDFEFAWKRAASAELGADYGYMFDGVKRDENGEMMVTALDDKTLEVTLSNALSYWDELLAFPVFYPVREDVVADEAWCTNASTFISNGAYKMTGWDHNSVITVAKNDGYWDAANVKMNEIKFYLSDDANNQLTNFKNGDWQLIDDVPTNEMKTLAEEYPTEYAVVGQIGTYYVCWNINENLLP